MNIERTNLGMLEEWVLSNPVSGDKVHIIPSYGGIIRTLVLCGCNILGGPTSEEALTNDNSYSNSILFPWGNRIKNGTYEFGGKSLILPINEEPLNNALHGFVYNKEFKVTETIKDENKSLLRMAFNYEGALSGYPFPFLLRVTVVLSVDGALKLSFKITNTGKIAMPFVLGWHPYFNFPGEAADSWVVKIQAEKEFLLDNQNIPVSSANCNDYYNSFSLRDKELNHVFLLKRNNKPMILTELCSNTSKKTIKLWQTTGENQFNYLVTYIPPHRRSIALEPMSGNIDAFNNKDGLISLEAGGVNELSCMVKLESL